VILILVSTFIVLFLPFLASFIVPGFTHEQLQLFILSTRFLMLQPLLLGLSALISCLGQVRHRFLLYSTAPLAYTFGIVLSIVFLYKPLGILGVIVGVLGGAFVGLAIQSYAIYQERLTLSLSYFSWRAIKEHLHNAIPRSGSTVISRVRDLIFASIATSLGVGALSIYVFAQRVMDAFLQVIVQSAATATLPVLSHHHATGKTGEYKKVLITNLIFITALSSLAALICILFSDDIVHILYGRGSGVDVISKMVVLLAYALPLWAINVYFVSAFSASKDGNGLFFANAIATVCSIIALLVSRAHGFGIVSLAIATWALAVIYPLLLVYFYTKKKH
jgi:putative peptidoglycan lipid II flippase